MPLKAGPDGTLVFGYLDTDSSDSAQAYDTVLVKATTPYYADMRIEHFGALTSCDIVGAQHVQVSPRPSAEAQVSGTLLGLLLAGDGTIEQDGRVCALSPGDFALYDGGRPFRLDLDGDYRWFLMRLDRRMVAQRNRNALANQRLTRSPSGRILSAMLTELAHRGHNLGSLARAEMGDHVTGVVRTLVREGNARDGDTGPDCSPQAPVLDRILDYIDHHLAEPLSPAQIATAHHISVRSLHALFQKQGETLGDHIRHRRLARIRRDLADPALSHLPAYAVAARSGIYDPSHFTKLFKSEFGLSPRTFRTRFRTG